MSSRTILEQHKDKYFSCSRCHLHRTAFRQVIFRGTLPCDVLFLGEAPGNTEDTLGTPFIGSSGKLLEKMISLSSSQEKAGSYSYGISNVICCVPRDDANKLRQPTAEEARECRPRLFDLIERAQPKLIVLLGKVAKKYIPTQNINTPCIFLQHPSYLLRKGGMETVEFKRNLIDLIEGVTQYAQTKQECKKDKRGKRIKKKPCKRSSDKGRKKKKAAQ